MELRHANNAARQDAINELIATANELHMSIAENPEIARIAAIAASNDQPEPGELEFHQLRHFSWRLDVVEFLAGKNCECLLLAESGHLP